MASTTDHTTGGSRTPPSSSFDRAINRFTNSLTPKQRQDFTVCSLEDVQNSIVAIQSTRGTQNSLRNLARIQGFLEGMDEYSKVVEAFLNCTPFMGYVWVWDAYSSNESISSNYTARDLLDFYYLYIKPTVAERRQPNIILTSRRPPIPGRLRWTPYSMLTNR